MMSVSHAPPWTQTTRMVLARVGVKAPAHLCRHSSDVDIAGTSSTVPMTTGSCIATA